MRNIALCSLAIFCNLWSFTSSARAQDCTPVVYAFRHAEDFDTMIGLTRVGVQHADLYPGMVRSFALLKNYCPVDWVYSMYDFNPDATGTPGTTNPFHTGVPLALQVSPGSFPHMQLKNGVFLYEKFQKGATSAQLRQELVSNAQSGASSAIFWTSEGLHDLGLAIADDTDIPKKCPSGQTCVPGTPPRNAVYVFEYNGSSAFNPPAPANGTQYLQCFNFGVQEPKDRPKGTNHYCKAGNIAINEAYIAALSGKICDTTNLSTVSGTEFKGPC